MFKSLNGIIACLLQSMDGSGQATGQSPHFFFPLSDFFGGGGKYIGSPG
jgi:hypothetical protein